MPRFKKKRCKSVLGVKRSRTTDEAVEALSERRDHEATQRAGGCCSARSVPGPIVNAIPPIQQNSMKNGYDENNNYNKSDENKCEINYRIITNNKWDVNTHINMQLTMHNKYTNDDVHTDACVVHIMR